MKDGDVRIQIVTERFTGYDEGVQKVVKLLDSFDPNFSARYYDTKFNIPGISGEIYYDGDKVNIFFLDMPSEKQEAFVGALKDKDWCYYIYLSNQNYEITVTLHNSLGNNRRLAIFPRPFTPKKPPTGITHGL